LKPRNENENTNADRMPSAAHIERREKEEPKPKSRWGIYNEKEKRKSEPVLAQSGDIVRENRSKD
jgi:hypothetical protein